MKMKTINTIVADNDRIRIFGLNENNNLVYEWQWSEGEWELYSGNEESASLKEMAKIIHMDDDLSGFDPRNSSR